MPEVVSWRKFAPLYLAGFSTVSIWIDLSPGLWLHDPPMAATARFTFWLFAFEVNLGKACEPWPLLSLSEFLDLLRQDLSQNPIKARYDDPVILFASRLLLNPSSVTDKDNGMVQDQVY